MIQKKYAKNLAQDAVNEGLLKGWALFRKVSPGKAKSKLITCGFTFLNTVEKWP